MPQKPYREYEKFKLTAKNGLKYETKAQKFSKDDFITKIW